MNHTPTETEPGVYRCSCGFYGIQTVEGIHVVESGAGRQLHLAAIAEQQIATRALVEGQIRGLIARSQAGGDVILSSEQVLMLGAYIKAEHGL